MVVIPHQARADPAADPIANRLVLGRFAYRVPTPLATTASLAGFQTGPQIVVLYPYVVVWSGWVRDGEGLSHGFRRGGDNSFTFL